MADTLPGVYIETRAEGLIVAGPISTGNIGIVGTAKKGTDLKVVLLSSFDQAKQEFDNYDAFDPANPAQNSLVRAVEIAFANGASSVYAVKVADTSDTEYENGLKELENKDVQIVVAAGKDDSFGSLLISHVTNASTDKFKRDRIAIVGSKLDATLEEVQAQGEALSNDDGRMIVVSPGIKFKDATLPAAYTAAAIAGVLSSRDPEVSLTNKTVSVAGLEKTYNPTELESLINAGVLALEERRGFRVVKGITTAKPGGAFSQITVRRIVDYARNGVRSAAESYIGLLNNDRVRKALKGSINGFLAGMVDDEMLTLYKLDVTATRDEEKRGIARVTMTLQPTFSIDFIKVVMFLE